MGDGKDRGDTMQNNIRNGLNKKVAFIGICCLLPVTILCARESGVQPAQVEFHDIVIVGGGISGLTAGYFLKDKDLVLLEKNDTVGGRTSSGHHKQFTYAKGTEYLGEPDDVLAGMVSKLGLEMKEIPSPMDAIYDGESISYGSDGIARHLIKHSDLETYNNFIKLISSEYKHYDEIPDTEYNDRTKKMDYMDAKSWLTANGIPEVYIDKYNVTSRGLFGAGLQEISALSLIPEVAFDYDDDEHGYVLDDEPGSAAEQYAEAKKESSNSYTFTKGISELTDKLGQALNGKLRAGSTVTGITRQGENYAVVYTQKGGKQATILARRVVIATPAPVTLKIADAVLSSERKEIMKGITYAPYVTVALFSDTPIFDKAFDLAVPDSYFFTDVYDATWVERFYDQQKKDRANIISVYIAPKTSHDQSILTMSDHELLKNVYRDLDKIFSAASKKITGYDIERFPYGYPVMSLGAYDRLLKLNNSDDDSIVLAGDYMIYPTFEAAVQSGYYAAEKILEADHD